MASGSIPPVQSKPNTLKEKIEKAYDDISIVLNPNITALNEFMTEYTKHKGSSSVSILETCIVTLFPADAKTPRSITASEVRSKLMDQLRQIKSQQRTDVASYVLHKDGQQDFTPKPLICLFVCGLIRFKYMKPFEYWMKLTKDSEIDYVRDFLSIIVEAPEIVVYSSSTNGVLTIDGEPNRKIPDKLFVTSSIPDDARNVVIMDTFPENDPWMTLSKSIQDGFIITSDPVLWYAYVLQDQNIIAFADPTQSLTKCIGIQHKQKDRKYIFAYGFPKYDREKSSIDPVSLWDPYINQPYQAYANVLESFKSTLTVDTAFIGKYTYEHPMIIYIHVLVMGIYGEDRNFYACNDSATSDMTIQGALVAGKTCVEYRNLLEHAYQSPIALTIRTGVLDENVMERLANAHLALMTKNLSFIFENDSIDENYIDLIASTCPVKYEWVFRSTILCKSQRWIQTISKAINDITTKRSATVDPHLGVLRRIAFWMCKNFQPLDPFMTTAQKLTKKVEIGAKVDGDTNKRIVKDLQKLGGQKGIFNRRSTLNKFLSDDPHFKAAMQTYFTEWHPDNVFGKYIVHDKNKDTYEVLDSAQMEIDNNDIEKQEVREERVPSSSSDSASSHSGYVSSGGESLPDMDDKWKAKPKDKPTGNGGGWAPLPPIMELNRVVDVLRDQVHGHQGGLDVILRELDAFVDVKGMNTKEEREAMKTFKERIRAEHADIQSNVTQMQEEINALMQKQEKREKKIKKREETLNAEIKTLRDDNGKKDGDLAAALLKDAEHLKQKSEDDAKMQTLKDEMDKLTAEIDKLNQDLVRLTGELADSQKKETDLTAKVAELEAEIVKLKQEIEDATTDKKNLLASDASKQTELDKLAAIQKELTEALEREKLLEGEKAKLENEMASLKALVDAEALDVHELKLEKDKLNEAIRDLRIKITEYEDQLKAITEKVKRAILENDKQTTSRMWKIHDKIDKDTQDELLQSKLLPLLKEGNYDAFLRLVKKDDVEKQHFESHALFLTYESIGATWKLIEDKTYTEEFRAEKLMHDLRLFQTIETHNEHIVENYTTHYFRKFLEAFGLIAGNGEKVPPFEIETF